MAVKWYGFTSLTGGGTGSLDGGDIVGDGDNLADGDMAAGIVSGLLHTYRLNATSSDSETSPTRIPPDTNPGTKMWELEGILIPLGGALSSYRPSGVIHVNTTSVGTDANTDEKVLMTYDLPANSLNANGKGVRITAYFTTAANGNTKTMKAYFGSTEVYSPAVVGYNNQPLATIFYVIRDGVGSQKAMQYTIPTKTSTPSEDETGAITIKITGKNAQVSANDIVAELLMIEFLN